MPEKEGLLYPVDRLAFEWFELERSQDELAKKIISYVERHGSCPKKNPRMQVSLGAFYELAAIAASRFLVDEKKAARFLRKCGRNVARHVLRRKVNYTVVRGAEKYLTHHAPEQLFRFRNAVKAKRLPKRIRVRELKAKEKKRAA